MLSAVFKSVLPEILYLHASCFAAVISGRGTNSGGSSSFLGSEYCFIFFKILVFSAVDNFFITGFDPQDVVLVIIGYRKEGGEIQALSRRVSFSSSAAGLSYVPELVAKTEAALRPLPRSFEVPSLGDFAAGMPEDLLRCPVRAFVPTEYLPAE